MADVSGRTVRTRKRSSALAEPEVDMSSLSGHVGFLLRVAQQNVFAEFHQRFAPLGITPARYSVLALLDNNPGARQAAIADALHIKQPNFTVLIDAMEGDGLVRRQVDTDNRRANRLTLTARGTALFKDSVAFSRQLDRSHARRIGSDDFQTLLDLLRRFTSDEPAGNL